ncbi:phage portal protein, partial [Gluconobacter albidus]
RCNRHVLAMSPEPRQISTVTSCINIITEDVSKIPFHMEQMTETNGWVPVPLVSPIGNIVRYPNSRHTMKEIFRMCIDDLIMNGNAYIVIIRDDSGMPSEFIYVSYNSVSVYENEEGDLIYNATHKMFKNKTTSDSKETGFTRNIHFEDMIHLKKNVINGEITGRGLIYTASEVFGLALAAQETAARTFNNGAAMPGFIKTDEPVDDETATLIKSRFMESQGGVNRSGAPAVMSGTTFVKTGMSPAELQLENARNQQTIEIARMLRVPLYKLAVPSSSETATLEEQEISYIHNTLNFYTTLIEEEFNRKIFLRSDMEKYRFHFDFTSIAIPDFQKRISAWAMAHTNGFVTSGYVAARENFPIPSDDNGGNQYVVPVNQAVISGDDSVPLGLSNHDGDKTPVHDTPMKQAEEVQ